jgi:hypothetical protein
MKENTERVSYTKFYTSYHEALSMLDDAQYGRVARAINDYVFFAKRPKLEGVENLVFIMAKPTLDSSITDIIDGKKGGRPSGLVYAEETPASHLSESEIPPFSESGNPPLRISETNVNVNVKVKENVKEKEKSADALEDAACAEEEEPFSFSEEVVSKNFENPEEEEAQPKPVTEAKAGESPETAPEPETRPKPGEPVRAWFNRQNPAATPPPTNALNPGFKDAASWFEELRCYWNETMRDLKQFYGRGPAQLDYDSREVLLAAFSAFNNPDIVKRAIDNYHAVLSDTDKYDPAGSVYKNFVKFLKSGIDNYRDEVAPLERYLSPDYKKRQEEEERKRRDNERTLAMIRKAKEKQAGVA